MERMTPIDLSSLRVGADAIVVFVGAGAHMAALLAFFVFVPVIAGGEGFFPVTLDLVLALVLALAFLLMHRLAERLTLAHSPLLLTCMVVGGVGVCGVLVAPGCLAAVIFYGLAGIGFAALSVRWFCCLTMQTLRRTTGFSAAIVGSGVLGCLIMALLDPLAASALVALAYLVSACCSVSLGWTKSAEEPVLVTNEESDRRSKITRPSAVMLAITYAEFGFVVVLASVLGKAIPCLVVSLVVSIFVAFDAAGRRLVDERRLVPFNVPLTALGFAPLFLFDDVGTTVCLGILSAVITAYVALGTAALAEHVRLSHLSPVRVFAKARRFDGMAIVGGAALGALTGWAVTADPVTAVRLSVGAAIAYSLVAAYCQKSHFPEPGMEQVVDAEPGSKSLWRQRCRSVGERCGLTERQCEVLLLMAQGRNAKSIEKALTISASTAQTHIRNIYRKTNVHSRQELLDLIEGTKLYGEE